MPLIGREFYHSCLFRFLLTLSFHGGVLFLFISLLIRLHIGQRFSDLLLKFLYFFSFLWLPGALSLTSEFASSQPFHRTEFIPFSWALKFLGHEYLSLFSHELLPFPARFCSIQTKLLLYNLQSRISISSSCSEEFCSKLLVSREVFHQFLSPYTNKFFFSQEAYGLGCWISFFSGCSLNNECLEPIQQNLQTIYIRPFLSATKLTFRWFCWPHQVRGVGFLWTIHLSKFHSWHFLFQKAAFDSSHWSIVNFLFLFRYSSYPFLTILFLCIVY